MSNATVSPSNSEMVRRSCKTEVRYHRPYERSTFSDNSRLLLRRSRGRLRSPPPQEFRSSGRTRSSAATRERASQFVGAAHSTITGCERTARPMSHSATFFFHIFFYKRCQFQRSANIQTLREIGNMYILYQPSHMQKGQAQPPATIPTALLQFIEKHKR